MSNEKPDKEQQKFGIMLTKLMTKMNISNKQISVTSGLSESHISRIIKGEREPKFSDIVKIARGLNLKASDIQAMHENIFVDLKPIFCEDYIIRPIVDDKPGSVFIYHFYALNHLELSAHLEQAGGKRTYLHIYQGRVFFNSQNFTDGDMISLYDGLGHVALYLEKGSQLLITRVAKGTDEADSLRFNHIILTPIDEMP
jgi:Predicted transcriptional regulator with C-terminal CBS domains